MKKLISLILASLLFIPISRANQSPTAYQIGTNWEAFDKNLNSSDTNVQYALQTLDQLIASGGGVWGTITGTLSNQTDLQNALNAKQNSLTFYNLSGGAGLTITNGTGVLVGSNAIISVGSGYYLPTTTDESNWNAKQNAISTGTTAQYLRGDLSLATFPTNLNQFTNGPGYITGVSWGQISGTLSNQTDLNNILGAKQGTISVGGQNYLSWVSPTLTANLIDSSNINWPNIIVPNTSINWAGLTILNGIGVNWSSFYPTSNPFNYITSSQSPVQSVSNTDKGLIISPTTGAVIAGVNWIDFNQVNLSSINWSSFYPTSNPFSYLTTVPWGSGTINNMTGINWASFYPTSNPFSFITGNQTITLSGDLSGTGTTSITTTLATVNSNIGTYQGITVNGKGLVTGAVNENYLTGNQSITLSGAVTGSGTTSISTTLANLIVQSANVNWNDINRFSDLNSTGINWNSINANSPLNTGGINWANFNINVIPIFNGNTAPSALSPTDCGAGQGSTGINSSGNATGCTTYLQNNQSISLTGPITGTGATSIATSITSQAVQSAGINWNDIGKYADLNSGGINWNNINSIGPINETGINWTNFPATGIMEFNGQSAPASLTIPLGVSSGGTNASSASITAFNNITGYSASGATGTTSANLVFSASPTLTGNISESNVGIGTLNMNGSIIATGNGNIGIGTITTGNITVTGLTNSEILSTNGSNLLTSLSTSTYPSLTELSYVKGVTSAIQTQINNITITFPASGDIVVANGTNSPSGIAPVNGDCITASGSSWGAGSCSGSAGSNYWNLNANIGIGTTNNVGIGTTVPWNVLDVEGTLTNASFFSNNVSETSGYGNVGIGTVNPTGKLQVYGSGTNEFASNVGIGTTLSTNALDIAIGGVSIGTLYAGYQTSPTNGLAIQGNVGIGTPASTGGALTVWGNVGINTSNASSNNNALVVMSGNVGIGTWTGQSILQIKGNVGIGTSVAPHALSITGGVYLLGIGTSDVEIPCIKNGLLGHFSTTTTSACNTTN